MAETKITDKQLAESHSAVSDTIITLVMTFAPAVLAVVLSDPTKKKKFRKVLKSVRDVLDGAGLDG
jgi:hypothetical protein